MSVGAEAMHDVSAITAVLPTSWGQEQSLLLERAMEASDPLSRSVADAALSEVKRSCALSAFGSCRVAASLLQTCTAVPPKLFAIQVLERTNLRCWTLRDEEKVALADLLDVLAQSLRDTVAVPPAKRWDDRAWALRARLLDVSQTPRSSASKSLSASPAGLLASARPSSFGADAVSTPAKAATPSALKPASPAARAPPVFAAETPKRPTSRAVTADAGGAMLRSSAVSPQAASSGQTRPATVALAFDLDACSSPARATAVSSLSPGGTRSSLRLSESLASLAQPKIRPNTVYDREKISFVGDFTTLWREQASPWWRSRQRVLVGGDSIFNGDQYKPCTPQNRPVGPLFFADFARCKSLGGEAFSRSKPSF